MSVEQQWVVGFRKRRRWRSRLMKRRKNTRGTKGKRRTSQNSMSETWKILKTLFAESKLQYTCSLLIRYSSDVNDLPMTIENCKSCIIFLNGLCKTVTIDNCKDVKIITFASDSVYIRDSKYIIILFLLFNHFPATWNL